VSGRYANYALAAIATTDASHMTCVANDFGGFVFSPLRADLDPARRAACHQHQRQLAQHSRAAEAAKESRHARRSLTGKTAAS
jgi:D-sedoheptulose 7-phosphate isomerase